jgi:hypothetical protein
MRTRTSRSNSSEEFCATATGSADALCNPVDALHFPLFRCILSAQASAPDRIFGLRAAALDPATAPPRTGRVWINQGQHLQSLKAGEAQTKGVGQRRR